MAPRTLLLALSTLMLLGCAGGPGADTAEAAAIGFFEAMGDRDHARAKTFLLSEEGCAKAPMGVDECKEFVKALHAALPEIEAVVPKGFRAEKATLRASEMPFLSALDVTPVGGGAALPVMTMVVDGRHYATFAVRAGGDDERKPDKDTKASTRK